MEQMDTLNKLEFTFCKNCGKTVKFKVARNYRISYSELKEPMINSDKFNLPSQDDLDKQNYLMPIEIENIIVNQILECPACKYVIFKKTKYEDSVFIESFVFPDSHQWHIEPQNRIIELLGEELSHIYDEIIKAYNGGLLLSTAACIRTFIENICKVNGVRGTSIEENINNLPLDDVYIGSLQKIRKISNNSIHEGYKVDFNSLKNSIRAIEILTSKIYALQIEEKEFHEIATIGKNINTDLLKKRRR